MHFDQFNHLGYQLKAEAEQLTLKLNKSRSVQCIQGHFSSFFGKEVLERAKQVVITHSDKKHQIIKYFREGLEGVYRISKAWDHALKKPFGYPGDFSTLELVYDGSVHPATECSIGGLIDQWSSSCRLSHAVKARKDALRVYLEDYIENNFLNHNHLAGNKLKLLSIASGGARELRELKPKVLEHLDISLLDQDPRALNYSLSCLQARAIVPPIKTILANIFEVNPKDYFDGERSFDLIYSFGLFDYLSDRRILECCEKFLPLLNEDGKFIFCLKDHRYFDTWFYDWCYDWKFVPRVAEDGIRLLDQAGLKLVDSLKTEGNIVCIYICEKK